MSGLTKILIIEDDPDIQKQLRWSLEDYHLLIAGNREEGMGLLRAHEPPLVLLDLGLPPLAESVAEGFRTLESIVSLSPGTKVIVMTGQGDRVNALKAIRLGAHDFYAKPAQPDTLKVAVARAIHVHGLEDENRRDSQIQAIDALPGFTGDSPKLIALAQTVQRIATSHMSVLIRGETGSGKRDLAKAIHDKSRQRSHTMTTVDCATLKPDAQFSWAGASTEITLPKPSIIMVPETGTLYLENVDVMPASAQMTLMEYLDNTRRWSAIDERTPENSLRILSSSKTKIGDLSADHQLSEELAFRLSEMVIDVPPLRERAGDALQNARRLLSLYTSQTRRRLTGFAPGAITAIDGYRWPGNMQELDNRIKSAVLVSNGPLISAEDLGLAEEAPEAEPLNLRSIRQVAEADAVRRALSNSRGNISKAARMLGVSRPTLYELMRQHSLRA